MCQVDEFSETSAVHDRIEDRKQDGQKGKETLKGKSDDCGNPSPYSGDHCRAYDCLREGKKEGEGFGCESEKSDMKEVKVTVHH